MYTFLIVIALVYGLGGRSRNRAIIIFINSMLGDVSKPVSLIFFMPLYNVSFLAGIFALMQHCQKVFIFHTLANEDFVYS